MIFRYKFLLGAGILITFGLVIFLSLRFLPQSSPAGLPSPLPNASDAVGGERGEETKKPAGASTRIINEREFAGPSLTYASGVFSPKEFTIKQNDTGDGCLIRIFNQSSQALNIRLSPHSPKDDRGFHYSAIPPGSAGIIDPRYRLPDVAFHNHDKPDEEFSVHLDESCLQ